MFVEMTLKEAQNRCRSVLLNSYSPGEADAITEIVLEHITNKNRNEIKLYAGLEILPETEVTLNAILERLTNHEPVQYIINEAWFYAMPFYVDKNVLIPRPETEELVHWIVTDNASGKLPVRILDIGTGSGCIPVALQKGIPEADVWACDISREALAVAQKNATEHRATVNLIELNILNPESCNQLPVFDIIVSNPPYIPEKDKNTMHPIVVNYEPSLALFVPDEDPLLFYKAIATFAENHLSNTGDIYLEIHEGLAKPVLTLFKEKNFGVELRKDMQQKDRMIKISR